MIRKIFFLFFISFTVTVLNFTACDNSESFLEEGSGYDNKHISMTNTAISQWDIGMTDGTIGFSRNLTGTYNPNNWSILSDEYCTGEGIPASLQDAGCPWHATLNPGSAVIGVCETRFTGGGEILDTTFVMRTNYQDSAADSLSKQVVYTHELGHCLGLRHTDNFKPAGTAVNYVMNSFVNPLTGPHVNELGAADAAYNPTLQNPPGSDNGDGGVNTYVDYYNQSAGAGIANRQYSLPVVYTYPYSPRNPAPKGLQKSVTKPESIPLTVPVTIKHYYIKANGHCDNVTILPNGTKIIKKSLANGKLRTVKITKK